MISKILRHLQGMALCMAIVILLALPEAVLIGGLSPGRGIVAAAACLLLLWAHRDSPCLRDSGTVLQPIKRHKNRGNFHEQQTI